MPVGPIRQDIGLTEFDFAGLLVEEDALVMVINGDSQFFLSAILANDVAVEKLFNLGRARQAAGRRSGLLALLVFKNRLADADTLVADVRPGIIGRRTDELLDLLLRLVTEGTAKGFVWTIFFHVCEGLSPGSGSGDAKSYSRPIFLLGERESMDIALNWKTYRKHLVNANWISGGALAGRSKDRPLQLFVTAGRSKVRPLQEPFEEPSKDRPVQKPPTKEIRSWTG